jgi:hypothetical protein
MRHIITRAALLGATGAVALAAASAVAAAPALAADAGNLPATVSVGSYITETETATSLNYGSPTPGTPAEPTGSGINPDGTFGVSITTNDPNGFTLTAAADDWSNGSGTFPASSIAYSVGTSDPGTGSTPFTEWHSGQPYYGYATMLTVTSAGSYSYQENLSLTVPSTVPSSSSPYTTTVQQTASAS